MPHPNDWRPNPGPQEYFLSLTCREALYGGSAGGGKSAALLVDAVRYVGRGYGPAYKALLLRRTFPELERSLIPESRSLYRRLGGRYNGQLHVWTFPEGETVWLSHLQQEDDIHAHQSAEYQFVGFDEVTSFTEAQYLYLGYSRMRSSRGVPLRLRAGTNPGNDGHEWVFRRFAPWLDPETKTRARPGQVLHFLRDGNGESVVPVGTPGAMGRTFVPAKCGDNPHLDSGYASGLDMLDPVTRAQLKDGNWLIKPGRGLYFKRQWFEVVDATPANAVRVRYWDRAGTGETEAAKRRSSDPDWTVGLLLAKAGGIYYVEDVNRFRGTPGEVQAEILRTAANDGKHVQVALEQDPGQAGKFEIATYVGLLDGLNVRSYPAREDKITRAQPASAQAEHGNFKLLRGAWNKLFVEELEAFPEGAHDDQVDALSGAHNSMRTVVDNSPAVRFTRKSQLDDAGY